KFDSVGSGDRYKANYNPYQPAIQPKMFNSEVPHQQLDDHYDQLQRDFLDSAQSTADTQQLAQLQILNKAQLRQIEDLEQKLEDSRRNMRYLEHQFAIVRDEKEGLAVSLKESCRVMEEAKEREVLLQTSVTSLELQVQALTDRDHEVRLTSVDVTMTIMYFGLHLHLGWIYTWVGFTPGLDLHLGWIYTWVGFTPRLLMGDLYSISSQLD
ncbi:unnamed protein product, partial [Oncorhynchus mykiss]